MIDMTDLTEEQTGLLHLVSSNTGTGARRAISYDTSAAAAAASSSKLKQIDFLGNPLSTPSPSPETVKFGGTNVSGTNSLGFKAVTVVPTDLWPLKEDRLVTKEYREHVDKCTDHAVCSQTTAMSRMNVNVL